MITMKAMKRGAIVLLLVAAFVAAGVYEALAIQALYGTYGKGEYSTSTLVEINPNTGEIIRIIGQVGHGVNGLAWDPTTQKLYGSARRSNTDYIVGGSHDGASGSAVLVDSSEDFVAEGVTVGMQVRNTSDGSWGTITAVSATTITASLLGGTDNDWDSGDSYRVDKVTFNGLLEIDLATGAGTPVGIQGWGLDYRAVVTNIAVNSAGQMYGWTENGDDLVVINKATGVATVVGNSGIGTYANGLAFDSSDTLYMVNGDGDYYIMNTSTGTGTFLGYLTPGDEMPAHHGVFELSTNVYYGIRNDKYPWENSSAFLVRANLAAGSVLSVVPTAYDLHTLAFVEAPCVLDLDLDYNDVLDQLEMQITLGTEEPAFFTLSLEVFNQRYPLGTYPVPSMDPAMTSNVELSFPNIGNVGVLATLVSQEEGIECSDWDTADTGF